MTTSSQPEVVSGLKRPVSLGLQGGGAYGAFTWGVLDRLLDDTRLPFDRISGTSAGAINAIVMADGMAHGGGRAGAQAALRKFWTALGLASRLSPLQRTPLDYVLGRWTLESSPGYHMMQVLSAAMAAVQFTPLRINPMRSLFARRLNHLRGCGDPNGSPGLSKTPTTAKALRPPRHWLPCAIRSNGRNTRSRH